MAKKPTTDAPAADSSPVITVKATTALYEAGVSYQAGETLEVTTDRAAALGESVTPT